MKKHLFLFIALITLAAMILGINISAVQAPSLSDVASDAWYAEPVLWAMGNNITQGTGPSTFSPDNTCTTAQIITFLWRAAGKPEPSIANPYSDVYSGSYYEKAAIWAYENQLVDGTTFNGEVPCTRLATVTYLWKLSDSPLTESSVAFDDISSDNTYAHAVSWAVNNEITKGTSTSTFSPYSTCTRSQIVTFLYRWNNNVGIPNRAETAEHLVWIPIHGGTKHHTNPNCSKMINPVQVTIEFAENCGYTDCKRCP
jgi:hypothetical protein